MDMYTEERYKRWVRQKIIRFIGFILIFLMLLINMILLSVLVLNMQACECDFIEGNNATQEHEAGHEEYRRDHSFENTNAIPGRYVLLTFDDGPSPYTRKILDILDEQNAPAVFFVIGDNINRSAYAEDLLNQILEEGHYIGLHTMTHEYTTLYSDEGAPHQFVDEMLELNELISEITTTNFSTNLCRAAYGMSGTFTPEHHIAVDQAGLYCVDWNIDSRDWEQRTAYLVHQNVTSEIESLGFPDELVILFHELSWTVEALPGIIDYLRYHGYTIRAYTPGDILTY